MKNKIPASNISNFIKLDIDPLDIIERKQYVSTITSEDERIANALISAATVDRDGDFLVPSGIDITKFTQNPIVAWNHQYSIPAIGKVEDLKIDNNGIFARIKFATTSFAEEIWQLVKGGFLKTCSVGFVTKEAVVRGSKEFARLAAQFNLDDTCKRIVTKWELVENSIVNLPANPDALIYAISQKSITLENDLIKSLGLTGLEIKNVEDIVKEVVGPTSAESITEVVKEEVKVEEVKVVEVKEEVIPPVKVWNIIRSGDYVLTDADKIISKGIKTGRVY